MAGTRRPIACPFYQGDDGRNTISCEGLVEGNQIILAYRDRGEFEKQLDIFCCKYYEKCEIYRAVAEKYEL